MNCPRCRSDALTGSNPATCRDCGWLVWTVAPSPKRASAAVTTAKNSVGGTQPAKPKRPKRRPGVKRSPELTPDRQLLLSALRRASRQEKRFHREVTRLIGRAKDVGCSWPQIGKAMGVTHPTAIRRARRSAD